VSWDSLYAAIAEARAAVAAAAPDAAVAAEGEAYVARVMAAGMGGAVLGHLFQQDGLSRALPCHGGPNPDYIMRFAPVDAAGHYRLEGRLNGSERIGVGLYGFGPNGEQIPAGYVTFDRTNCAADGGFSLELGGNGLPIQPGTRVMLARVLHRDPASDPAQLRFTGGAAQPGLALATGSADGALAFVARSLASNVREYLKWSAAAHDLRNRLDVAPPELTDAVQGDPDTQYYLGGFDLCEDEWLEVTMPEAMSRPEGISGYWSLHAYNYWYEHLQTPGVHDRNARRSADGRIRIAVGPGPGAHAENRIDTLGRRRGAFICRIIGQSGVGDGLRHAAGRPMAVVRRL
jgi:hypothetical protein